MINYDPYCILDGKPIDESEVYQVLLNEFGKEEADRWTDVVEWNYSKSS